MGFLGIEGLHAFVTGARGGIGSAIVNELLEAGCKVTAHDLRGVPTASSDGKVFHISGDISDESSISAAVETAQLHFGPINILCANAGIADEAFAPFIWDVPLDEWDRYYRINARGTFLTIKHFLGAAKDSQIRLGAELDNLAIVVTGSECGKFGQAGHVAYSSGKAALQYGLVRTVKNEIVRLNSKARINAVAPGWVNTPLIGDALDDPNDMYNEAQGTVPLRKIAQPTDVAKTVAFLASHKAAGHLTGECISVDGGMEGRIVWRQGEVLADGIVGDKTALESTSASVPRSLATSSKPRKILKVAWSIDFDAVSGWLGTGAHPDNSTSDYSAGYFSGLVGVPRLLKVFRRLGISNKVTWCIPGHSMETFPSQTRAIVDSGAEIALHGYAHESASQMTAEQEREVLLKSIELAENLTGKRPKGYRAPLYQLKERTIALLQEQGFLWDSSLSHHDSTPYFLPTDPAPIEPIDFDTKVKAGTWMHPSPRFAELPKSNLVEIPANWYAEDMTPMQFLPHTPNSHGYVDVRVMENMWKDRFTWLLSELEDGCDEDLVYSIIIHPDTSGMAHIIGMVERFLRWVLSHGDRVEFQTYSQIADDFRRRQAQL